MSKGLMVLDEIQKALAKAESVYEVLEVKDRAKALEVYMAAKGASEIAAQAKELQLRAERKAGQFFRGMEKNKGGRGNPSGGQDEFTQVLEELGLSHKTVATEWYPLANMPDKVFEAWIAQARATGDLSRRAAIRHGKEWFTEQDRKEARKVVEKDLPKAALPIYDRGLFSSDEVDVWVDHYQRASNDTQRRQIINLAAEIGIKNNDSFSTALEMRSKEIIGPAPTTLPRWAVDITDVGSGYVEWLQELYDMIGNDDERILSLTREQKTLLYNHILQVRNILDSILSPMEVW